MSAAVTALAAEPSRMTKAEVAVMCRASEKWVEGMVRKDLLHPVRLGGRVLFDRDEVLKLLNGSR